MAEFKGSFGNYGFDPEKDKQRTFAKDVVDTIKNIPNRLLGGITTSGYGEKSTWYNQPKIGDQNVASDIKKRTAGGAGGGNGTAALGIGATTNPVNNQATATNSPINYSAFDTTGKLGTQVPTPFESTSPTAVEAMQQMKDAVPAGETNIKFDLTDPKYQEARNQVFGQPVQDTNFVGPQQPKLPGAQEGTAFGGSPNRVSDNVMEKLDQRSRAYYALGGVPPGQITGNGTISSDPATIQAAQAISGRNYGSDSYGNGTEFSDRLSAFRTERQKEIDAQRARFNRADARRSQQNQQKMMADEMKMRNQVISNLQDDVARGKISSRAANGIIAQLIGNPRGEGIQAETAANQLAETQRSNLADEANAAATNRRQRLNDLLTNAATLRGQDITAGTASMKEAEAMKRRQYQEAEAYRRKVLGEEQANWREQYGQGEKNWREEYSQGQQNAREQYRREYDIVKEANLNARDTLGRTATSRKQYFDAANAQGVDLNNPTEKAAWDREWNRLGRP